MSYSYRVTTRNVPTSRTRTTFKTHEPEMERTRRDFERMHQDSLLNPLDSKWRTGDYMDGHSISESGAPHMYETNPETGKKEFRYTFDVKGVQPEDVEVKIDGDTLTISGTSNEGSMKRNYSRQIEIPRDVDKASLIASLSDNGNLQVTAPVLEEFQPKSISASSPSPVKSKVVKVTRTSQYKGEYSLVLDVGEEFVDGDISVHYVDEERKLIATGKKISNHIRRVSTREFTEEIDMDDSIDPDTIKASIDDFGKLSISAMKTK